MRAGKAQNTGPTTRGIRGVIAGFSRASRRRLMRKLASLDQDGLELPLFITLTYPGQEWLPYALQHKRHLDALCKQIARAFPESFLFWKLEPQHRGAPHYHLLLFNVPYWAKESLALAWWQIVGSGQATHLEAGTSIGQAMSWGEVTNYTSKYLGKLIGDETYADPAVASLWQKAGRYWGVRYWALAPVKLETWQLSLDAYHRMRRFFRRLAASRKSSKRPRGCKLAITRTMTTFVGYADARRMLAYLGAWIA